LYPIYQAGIRIFFFLAGLLAVFSFRARKFHKGRAAQRKSNNFTRPEGKKLIWFHASSLGEYEQGQPLIKKWKEERPDWLILLTFFSPSGFEQEKVKEFADHIDYIPADTVRLVKNFLDTYRPDISIFIKYDIWPVLLRELNNRNIPAYLVSAVFRESQLFFRWYGAWYFSALKYFNMIFTQEEASSGLLISRGLENVMPAGDTRIDRVIQIASSDNHIEGIREFSIGARILIAGSSWPAEERILARFRRHESPGNIKLILAPHDTGDDHISSIEALFGDSLVKYSELHDRLPSASNKEVLLIDKIGLLSRLYSYGDFVFIGGAFGRGLHNILEPAVFGLPVIFGPDYKNFVEAVELVKSGAAFPVENYDEFISVMRLLTGDKDAYLTAGKGCENFVKNRAGATTLIIRHLLENI
jgi:3-deoxy-D-manno-octulosonic-acid transferase